MTMPDDEIIHTDPDDAAAIRAGAAAYRARAHAEESERTLWVPCEFCQSEGGMFKRGQNVWDEVDHGPFVGG